MREKKKTCSEERKKISQAGKKESLSWGRLKKKGPNTRRDQFKKSEQKEKTQVQWQPGTGGRAEGSHESTCPGHKENCFVGDRGEYLLSTRRQENQAREPNRRGEKLFIQRTWAREKRKGKRGIWAERYQEWPKLLLERGDKNKGPNAGPHTVAQLEG